MSILRLWTWANQIFFHLVKTPPFAPVLTAQITCCRVSLNTNLCHQTCHNTFPKQKGADPSINVRFQGNTAHITQSMAGFIRRGLHSRTLRYIVSALEAQGLTGLFVQSSGAPLTMMKLDPKLSPSGGLWGCADVGIRGRWKGQPCQNVGAEASWMQLVFSFNVSWLLAPFSPVNWLLILYLYLQVAWFWDL